MKVREIELGDLFLASKIVSKIDLKEMVKEIGFAAVAGMTDEEREEVLAEKSMDILMYLIEKVDGAQKEILTLMGAWCGITAEEASKLKWSELQSFVEQFLEVNGKESIQSFFKQVAGLTKPKQ